ncbi:MAG: ATP-binding cassette domain-containing protein [Erysipelotrichaceae bacterium]|nr:ATP-binding cassette domain-containing protein [Erysipelotrichaceae bacterium]
MIELIKVNKFYSSNGLTNIGLRNINLKLNKGEFVAITGDSGSGKSTLLNVIAKIDSFDEGEIYYKGNDTSYFSLEDMDDFRKNKVGFIFQNYNIIESYSVLENVMLPLLACQKSRKEAKKIALEYILKVGLHGKEKNKGSHLSGGEKQRCVIARALASNCEILALDEPTGNLDSKTSKEIIDLVYSISKDKLVLFVTHDYESIKNYATRKIKLNDGEIIEDITFKKVNDDDNVEVNLDYQPLLLKTCVSIAKNNVLFTPKKTMLLFSIFFFISMVVLFAFQLIQYSFTSSYFGNNQYVNLQDNRLYVYNANHQQLDVATLNEKFDNVVTNPFYEDTFFYYTIDEENHAFLYNRYVPYEIKNGRAPINDKEVFLVIPKENKNQKLDEYINKEIIIDIEKPYSFILSGYGTSSSINATTLTGNNTLEKALHTYMFTSGKVISLHNKNYMDEIFFMDVICDDQYSSITLSLPNSYVDDEYFLMLANFYQLSKDSYQINYENIPTPKLTFSLSCFLNNNVYEASVYSSSIKDTIRQLKQLDYTADYPFNIHEEFDATYLMDKLTSYALMFIASIFLLLGFSITYFILSKIYESKKKDYEIARTLGITKKDMRKIVISEVMLIGLSSIASAYIISFILIYSINALKILKPIELMPSLLYLFVLLFFTYSIAKKFNNNLFKFSVTSSLKEDR